MQTIEITRAKSLRGNIIEKLYSSYGEDISLSVLKGLLRYTSECREIDIKKAIFFRSGNGI